MQFEHKLRESGQRVFWFTQRELVVVAHKFDVVFTFDLADRLVRVGVHEEKDEQPRDWCEEDWYIESAIGDSNREADHDPNWRFHVLKRHLALEIPL